MLTPRPSAANLVSTGKCWWRSCAGCPPPADLGGDGRLLRHQAYCVAAWDKPRSDRDPRSTSCISDVEGSQNNRSGGASLSLVADRRLGREFGRAPARGS